MNLTTTEDRRPTCLRVSPPGDEAWAESLGVSLEAVQIYGSTEVVDLQIDSFTPARLFRYNLFQDHPTGLALTGRFGHADFPRALRGGVGGAVWSMTTNPLRSARGQWRTLLGNLELVQQDIWKEAGTEFNISSNPQLREILYEKLGLPVLKRTKTGPSTDAGVLEELAAQDHRVPVLLMEYREMEKLRGTYVDALPRMVNPRTGRIHTSFNQAVAATGRLSSSDPNLQNIPIRTQLGREIRKGFIAEPGHVLLAADYSQIELRILAHFSGDEPLVQAFQEGIDVHRQTAAVVFDVPVEMVTAEQRGRAKTINFATLYGQGAFALARQLGIPRDEAKEFIAAYFERFSGVRRFLDEQVASARELGYVETLLGRRRYIPELQSSNGNIRQFGERIAQNTPIQGTAADLLKKAMIEVDRALEGSSWGARLLLTVHDELLFEVPEERVDEVRPVVVGLMEGAVELSVPVAVDWGVGTSWYETKG